MSSELVQESPSVPVASDFDPRLGRTTIRSFLTGGNLGQLPVLVALILIGVYFNISSNGLFLSSRNITNLLLQVATIGTLGLASVLVLLIGEIDLSLGVVSYLCAAVTGVLSVQHGWNAWLALLAGVVVGAVIGLVNGFFVSILKVPSFVVTLAGLLAYQGAVIHVLFPQTSLLLTDPRIANIATDYLPFTLGWVLPLVAVGLYILGIAFGRIQRQGTLLSVTPLWVDVLRVGLTLIAIVGAVYYLQSYFGIPQSTAILLGLVILFWLLMRFTAYGRHIYAVGGNAEAARRAGINVIGIRISVFVLASTLAAVGGILQASRLDTAASDVDQTLLLNAIATAVIGGVSLFGGRGSVWAVVIGSLVIGSLANGLALLAYGPDIKYMVEGVVLIIAVTIDALGRQQLSIGAMIWQLLPRYWKVVTKPGWRTFLEESDKADWPPTLVQLFGYVLIVAILSFFVASPTALLLDQTVGISPGSATIASAAGAFIASLIGFLLFQGLFYGFAKAFSGQGTFVQQAYTFLLFQVPLGILSSLLAFIPAAGAYLGIIVGIYEIVLSILAIMGVHKLSSGKASVVVLIPIVALIALLVVGILLLPALVEALLRGMQGG
jgi:D-xylose transport system permease protein